MSDLSSCYFCGTALDAPLDRHTLAASGDDPTTVVLCPTCRRKLVSVLERVLVAAPDAETDTLVATAAAAVDDPTDDAPAVADVTPDQGVGAPLDVTDDSENDGAERADASPPDTDHADGVPANDAEADEEGSDDEQADRDARLDESGGRTAAAGDAEPIFAGAQSATEDDDEEAVFGGSADATAATGTGEVGGEEVDEEEGDDDDDTAASDDASDDDVVREAEPTRDGDGTAAAEEPTAADEGGPQRASGAGAVGASETPAAETYNRVIRLLQNREFPVRTAEIEEVAVNAYGMEPTDFRAVVDAAVERGVIDERGERLVRPN